MNSRPSSDKPARTNSAKSPPSPPDISLPERHRIKRARHPVPIAAAALVVLRRHQEGEQDFEGIIDLGAVEAELEARPHPRATVKLGIQPSLEAADVWAQRHR